MPQPLPSVVLWVCFFSPLKTALLRCKLDIQQSLKCSVQWQMYHHTTVSQHMPILPSLLTPYVNSLPRQSGPWKPLIDPKKTTSKLCNKKRLTCLFQLKDCWGCCSHSCCQTLEDMAVHLDRVSQSLPPPLNSWFLKCREDKSYTFTEKLHIGCHRQSLDIRRIHMVPKTGHQL